MLMGIPHGSGSFWSQRLIGAFIVRRRTKYKIKGGRIFRKILLIVLVMTLLVTSGAVIGCGAVGISGTYVNEDNSDEYLELNEDGTFYLKEMGLGLDGEWEVKDDELRLHFTMGLVATAEIEGNKIYDEDGKAWVKQ